MHGRLLQQHATRRWPLDGPCRGWCPTLSTHVTHPSSHVHRTWAAGGNHAGHSLPSSSSCSHHIFTSFTSSLSLSAHNARCRPQVPQVRRRARGRVHRAPQGRRRDPFVSKSTRLVREQLAQSRSKLTAACRATSSKLSMADRQHPTPSPGRCLSTYLLLAPRLATLRYPRLPPPSLRALPALPYSTARPHALRAPLHRDVGYTSLPHARCPRARPQLTPGTPRTSSAWPTGSWAS